MQIQMNYKYVLPLNKQIKKLHYTQFSKKKKKNLSIMYKTQHILITTIFFFNLIY